MLTITNNLDRTDEAAISNWPFTYESTLDTGDGVLTGDSFLSVSVNVDETVELPCRFKGVSSDGRLIICDASGAEVCSGQLYERTDANATTCSFFLYNKYGVLSGVIFCKPNVPSMLWSLSRYANDMHYFATNAFVFLPQCHVQSAQGNVRSFGINGTYTTANLGIRCTKDSASSSRSNPIYSRISDAEGITDVALFNRYPAQDSTAFYAWRTNDAVTTIWTTSETPENGDSTYSAHNMTAERSDCPVIRTVAGFNMVPESSSVVSYGVFNFDENPEPNKWCRITVNGTTYNVEDKNLIIRASVTSNLRVVHSDAAIILRGVLDAQ